MNRIYWPVALFLVLNPLISFTLLALYLPNWHWGTFAFALIFAAATNLSITAGYHRLFSHKSYDAHPLVKWGFLLIGASAFQGSALKWSSDHRRHHSFVDGEKDPYSINKGFWYAHMGWLFLKDEVDQKITAPDLEKDKAITFQHQHFVLLGILAGFIFPMLFAGLWGDMLGGLVLAGGLRIFFTQQSTFFVNSLCHTLGKQTYSKEISARDSFIVAILTHGEGYHNFHHKFQIDYRNGIKWYQWDPTKWTIQGLSALGLAQKLRTIPMTEILKARLQVEAQTLLEKGFAQDKIEAMRAKILEAQQKMRTLAEEYAQAKKDYSRKTQEMRDSYQLKLTELKREIELSKIEFQMGLRQWRVLLT